MKITPDLFVQNAGRQSEGLLGLEYPDCPIKKVCAYVNFDHEPMKDTFCEYFLEPQAGKREPECVYIKNI